jgi:hypothetical protein
MIVDSGARMLEGVSNKQASIHSRGREATGAAVVTTAAVVDRCR